MAAEVEELLDQGDELTLAFHPRSIARAVEDARAVLAGLSAMDERQGLAACMGALGALESAPGAEALRLREQLSRAVHALSRGKRPRFDTGPLGPTQRYCACGSELPRVPASLHPEQCNECWQRHLIDERRRELAARRPEGKTMPEERKAPEAAPEVAWQCKVCGKPEGEVTFRTGTYGKLHTCNHCIALRSGAARTRKAAQRKAAEEQAAAAAQPPVDTCNVVTPEEPEAPPEDLRTGRRLCDEPDNGAHQFTEAATFPGVLLESDWQPTWRTVGLAAAGAALLGWLVGRRR